jgi:hypothetical protein
VHGMSYSHPWISTFLLTYTTSYDPLDRPPDPPGQGFGSTNYPQVIDIALPFGENLRWYLRDLDQRVWVQLRDSEQNDVPVWLWYDPSQGALWCKWLKPTGPQ